MHFPSFAPVLPFRLRSLPAVHIQTTSASRELPTSDSPLAFAWCGIIAAVNPVQNLTSVGADSPFLFLSHQHHSRPPLNSTSYRLPTPLPPRLPPTLHHQPQPSKRESAASDIWIAASYRPSPPPHHLPINIGLETCADTPNTLLHCLLTLPIGISPARHLSRFPTQHILTDPSQPSSTHSPPFVSVAQTLRSALRVGPQHAIMT